MQYRKLGRTGVDVSSLCLGTMMFGGATNEKDSIRIIHRALDAGINFVDTANIYNQGESEVVVGRGLVDRRERVVLATKAGVPVGEGPNMRGASRHHLLSQLDASLRRLDTDYIDLFYIHVPDEHTAVDESLRALDDAIQRGKVLYGACSNFRSWQLSNSLWTSDRLGLAPVSCVQPLYNIVNRDIEVELLPLCRQQRLGVVSYSPLARGILTGKYVVGQPLPEGSRADRGDVRIRQAELRDASLEIGQQLVNHCQERDVDPSQFALAWCLANRAISSVIVGPRTMEHFENNLEALEVTLDAEDEALVDSLVPPGEHSGKGFPDPGFPVTGRFLAG
ncbi:MAG: NADP-dependent oxidoreductase [Planctomycetaceae bacterium]|nr:NADP-dependent oxidoreductase [Planctomycetaceae bacterium]MBP60977.1 NADP-dependent oxidoreductase [Planctomycetaceae bacterium]